MSIIALSMNDCWENHPVIPVLFGDILFSSNWEKENVSLPTFLEGVQSLLPPNLEYQPIALSQKIYVVDDFTAVALAGNLGQMQDTLNAIKTFLNDSERKVTEKNSFMNEADLRILQEHYLTPLKLDNCSFCIAVTDGSKFSAYPFGKWITRNTQMFGNLLISGSGANDLIEYINSHDLRPEPYDNIPWMVYTQHLNLFGYLLALEKSNFETLLGAWGAGYEAIYCEMGKWKKIDNISFLFVTTKKNDQNEAIGLEPLFAFNSKYYKNLLLISALNIKDGVAEGFLVPPIDINDNEIDFEALPPKCVFDSNDVCVVHVPEFEKHKKAAFSTFVVYRKHLYPHERDIINIKSSDGNVEVFIDPEVVRQIIEWTSGK